VKSERKKKKKRRRKKKTEPVVVSDHDGRIKGLEIQDQDWVVVQAAFRFEDQLKTLRCIHFRHLKKKI